MLNDLTSWFWWSCLKAIDQGCAVQYPPFFLPYCIIHPQMEISPSQKITWKITKCHHKSSKIMKFLKPLVAKCHQKSWKWDYQRSSKMFHLTRWLFMIWRIMSSMALGKACRLETPLPPACDNIISQVKGTTRALWSYFASSSKSLK